MSQISTVAKPSMRGRQISAKDIHLYQLSLFTEDSARLREAASKKIMKLPRDCPLELRIERYKTLEAYNRLRKVVANHFLYVGPDGRKGTSKSGMVKAINVWIKKGFHFDVEYADQKQLRVLTIVRDAVSHSIEVGEAFGWTRKDIKLKCKEVINTLARIFSFEAKC